MAALSVWLGSFYTSGLSPSRTRTRRLVILLLLLCSLGQIEATGPPSPKDKPSNSSNSAAARTMSDACVASALGSAAYSTPNGSSSSATDTLEDFVRTQVESAFSPVARSFTTVELEHQTALLQAMAAAHINTWMNSQQSTEERIQSIMANQDALAIMHKAWQQESQEDDTPHDAWDNTDLREFVLTQAEIYLVGGTASSHVERFYADEFQRAYVQVQRSTRHLPYADLTPEL